MSFVSFSISMHLFISSIVLKLLKLFIMFSYYTFYIYRTSCGVTSFITGIYNLCIFYFLVILTRGLLIFFDILKQPVFYLISLLFFYCLIYFSFWSLSFLLVTLTLIALLFIVYPHLPQDLLLSVIICYCLFDCSKPYGCEVAGISCGFDLYFTYGEKYPFIMSLISSHNICYQCAYQHSNLSNGNKYITLFLTAFIPPTHLNNKIGS